MFDPEIEWTDPVEHPSGGTYRGLAAVTAHFSASLRTWAEGSCEPERLVVIGDSVVAFVHVHVRLKGSADWIDARLADVFTFRSGKVIPARSFPDAPRALAWAAGGATDTRRPTSTQSAASASRMGQAWRGPGTSVGT